LVAALMIVDLSNAVVLIESRWAEVAGDITLFKNFRDLIAWVEPVDVNNGEYFVCTLTGNPVDLSVENDQVRIAEVGTGNEWSSRVRHLLELTAENVLKARGNENAREIDPRAMSVEGLAELIGFQR
jgi:hypothetical protein